jgi:hypothetical protein
MLLGHGVRDAHNRGRMMRGPKQYLRIHSATAWSKACLHSPAYQAPLARQFKETYGWSPPDAPALLISSVTHYANISPLPAYPEWYTSSFRTSNFGCPGPLKRVGRMSWMRCLHFSTRARTASAVKRAQPIKHTSSSFGQCVASADKPASVTIAYLTFGSLT